MARSGYTLPVFAVAAAKAALSQLQCSSPEPLQTVTVDLLPDEAIIPIQQVARLDSNSALAITISDCLPPLFPIFLMMFDKYLPTYP